MTKTQMIISAVALTLSTAATGCAVEQTPCPEGDCIEIEDADYAPAEDLELTERGGVEAGPARDANLSEIPARTAELHDWTLRLLDGEEDACDTRFARAYEQEQPTIVIEGCEDSVITAFVDTGVTAEAVGGREIRNAEAGRPEAVALAPLTVEETRYMLLGLDIMEDLPLTVEQEQLVAEAESSQLYRQGNVTAEAYDARAIHPRVEEPAFHPGNLN